MNEIAEQDLIYNAAIVWALCQLVAMLFFSVMFFKYGRLYLLLYAIAALMKALWGITVPGASIEVVRVFNAVVLPSATGIIVVTATYLFYRDEIKRAKSGNK